MSRRHVVVTGTGRAGTTFLIELFTHLGLDTGFELDFKEYSNISKAGLEKNVLDEDAPYIVKSPFLCDYLEDVVKASIKIDHAIVPVRNFEAAAASRAHIQALVTGSADGERRVWGGLWSTDSAADQANQLRLKFTNLVEVLVRFDVPFTFLHYPRLVQDPGYLYSKLNFLLSAIDLKSFLKTFERVSCPEWVHQFLPNDARADPTTVGGGAHALLARESAAGTTTAPSMSEGERTRAELTQLKIQNEKISRDLGHAAEALRQHATLLAENERLRTELLGETANLRDELGALRLDNERISRDLEEASDALQQQAALQQDFDTLNGQILHLSEIVRAFQESTSWRITAPFRAARSLFGKTRDSQ